MTALAGRASPVAGGQGLLPHEVGEGYADRSSDAQQPGQARVGRAGLDALEGDAVDSGAVDEVELGEVGPHAFVLDTATDGALALSDRVVLLGGHPASVDGR